MNILIKGMDMPKCCFDCSCLNAEYCQCQAIGKTIEVDWIEHRPDWCPLIEVPEWISVTERLPENMTSVIVRRKDGGIFIWEYFYTSPTDDCWIDDSMNVYSFYDVTHWMPLPKPPKDGEP